MTHRAYGPRLAAAGAACLLTAIACTRGASPTPGAEASQANTMSSPDEAARKVMESLPQLVTAANFQSMGFTSLDEVKAAELGRAVPRRTVSYELMLAYQPGTPLSKLFANEEQMVYPVQATRQVRTTATVTRRPDGKWQVTAVGDPHLGSLFAAAGSDFEIISVPGLNLEFGGIRRGEEWTLIPVRDYAELKFARGARIESAQALPVIAAHAREFDKRYGAEFRKKRLVR